MKRRLLLLTLPLALMLTACAGGDWLPLGAVERPMAAVSPDAGRRAPAAPPVAVPAPGTAEKIVLLRGRYDDLQATLAASLAIYEKALDAYLATDGASPLLAENWSAGQSALSRLSADIDRLRALNDEATSVAAALIAGPADSQLLLTAGELVAAADTAYRSWRQRLYGEQNRLAVLTPADVGSPGPNAVAAGTRTAFARIDFRDPNPTFDAKLRQAVAALRGEIPDVGVDVIASGPSGHGERQQAAVRRVLQSLRAAGIDYSRSNIALTAEGEVVRVAIYLKKTSL